MNDLDKWIAVGVGLHEDAKQKAREAERRKRPHQTGDDMSYASALGTVIGFVLALIIIIVAFIVLMD